MTRAFQDGDEVVHKSDRNHRMTVFGYTSDGKVICRWKEKSRFKSEVFVEAELEKWNPSNDLPFVVNPPRPRY